MVDEGSEGAGEFLGLDVGEGDLDSAGAVVVADDAQPASGVDIGRGAVLVGVELVVADGSFDIGDGSGCGEVDEGGVDGGVRVVDAGDGPGRGVREVPVGHGVGNRRTPEELAGDAELFVRGRSAHAGMGHEPLGGRQLAVEVPALVAVEVGEGQEPGGLAAVDVPAVRDQPRSRVLTDRHHPIFADRHDGAPFRPTECMFVPPHRTPPLRLSGTPLDRDSSGERRRRLHASRPGATGVIPAGPGPRLGTIPISPVDSLLLVGAGALAGMVGTAGGITSVISYPALLAVGVPALPANVTNIVALVTCWPGSGLASRPELRGRAPWLRRWGLVAAAGGAVGAGLLLSTPSGVFGRVVPFLLVFASLGLLLQPRLSAWQEKHSGGSNRVLLSGGLFAVSLYNGYFGAGAGVMVLALLLLTADRNMARANALKNMLVGVATVFSAAAFILFGPVEWTAAVPLAIGLFVGSMVGPAVARRIPANVLRWLVALTGLGLAVQLWVAPG